MQNKIQLKVKLFLFIFFTCSITAQHYSKMYLSTNFEQKTIHIKQELTYNNSSSDTLNHILLNDWNNAFSSKNSALANRFSDEFYRGFHFSKEIDRGYTLIHNIEDENNQKIKWYRVENHEDIIKIELNNSIPPCSKITLNFEYTVKIPNEKFTKYGFDSSGKISLKNWYLNPSRYENKEFVLQSNENIDDIPNAASDFEIITEIPNNYFIFSSLQEISNEVKGNISKYILKGKNYQEVVLYLSQKQDFVTYKNEIIEVKCGLDEHKVNALSKVILADKITRFIHENLGDSKVNKLLISQEDYQRQPFYGLNQLPSFLSPFPQEFMFELKFLKTYLYAYLKENLQLNLRKDYWILDGIQVFLMMKYIDEFYPDITMTGNLSSFKLLKSYHFINLPFNQQYNYLYMMMARKNLDQPLDESKNRLIKFNEQIASKYKSGLNFKFLDSYLEQDIVLKSIQEFIKENQFYETNSYQLQTIIEKNASKNCDWFFTSLVKSRDLIDYKFGKIKKTDETITVTIKNKSEVDVPIALYQLKENQVVNKIWLTGIKKDSTLILPRFNADKLALNYFNELPEYNLRNNWKSLKGFFSNNRPLKFNFFKDLEEPFYNQIFYVPEVEFNIYDGVALGLLLSNKSLLNKPFVFNFTPMYSSNTQTLVGKFSTMFDNPIRDAGKLYNIRYILSASRFHYTKQDFYTIFIPIVQFRFRDSNFRKNKNEFIQFRQIYVNRENAVLNSDKSTANYNIFNAKYGNFQSEGTKNFSLSNDLQLSTNFGKVATELNYRKLFDNNREISIRFYAGAFVYRSTNSDFFSFGLYRPNDYMFDSNLLGRSENSGIFSQQYLYAEGGFKSKFDTRFANQWISTINTKVNIWNWIQVYGDVGLFKNKYKPTQFIFDSGFHLNLVPDYFELFLPVYSSNGFALNDVDYPKQVRFVVTLTPKTLISLFTRKWF